MTPLAGSLTEDLPYWDIHRDLVVLADGRFVPILAFDLPARDLASVAELGRDNDALAQMLRHAVPEGAPLSLVIHTRRDVLDVAEAYRSACTSDAPVASAVTDDRLEQLRTLRAEGRLFRHRAYLSTALRPPEAAAPAPARRVLGRRDRYQSLSLAEVALRRSAAVRTRDALARHLVGAGFEPSVPDAQEIFAVMYQWFNPGGPVPTYAPPTAFYPRGVLRHFPELSPATLRRQVTDSDLDNNPYDHLWLSGRYLVGLTMEKLPDDATHAGMIDRLIALPCEKWIVLSLEHVPFARQLGAFKWKARLLRGLTSATGDDVDPSNESGFATLRDAAGHMTIDNSHVYRLGLTLFLYARELEGAERALERARGVGSEMHGARFLRERAGLSKRFRTLAPFAGGVSDIADLVFQENAADFFPLGGPWPGVPGAPDAVYQTRWDTPAGVRVFDPRCGNWNGIVVGAARSGKSFHANDLLAGVLRRADTDAVVLDKGGSFRETVRLFGGAIIEIERASINPFDLPSGQHRPDERQLALLGAVYRAMLGDAGGDAGEEEALLKAATLQLYRRATVEDAGGRRYRGALLQELVKLLPVMQQVGERPITPEQRALANRLATKLSNWTGGDLKGGFVNRPTSVDLSARVLCFETAGLEHDPALHRVALMLVNHLIWKRLKEERGRYLFILEDEFAVQLRDPYATAVADEISRTAPKYGGAFWVITQSFKDFDQPQAKAILTNTSHHLLYPAPSEESVARELLDLPDHTLELYRSLGGRGSDYRECLYLLRTSSGQREGGVLVVRPTPKGYWAYTSHNREVALKEETIRRFGGDVAAALEHLAREHPKGLLS